MTERQSLRPRAMLAKRLTTCTACSRKFRNDKANSARRLTAGASVIKASHLFSCAAAQVGDIIRIINGHLNGHSVKMDCIGQEYARCQRSETQISKTIRR